MSDETAVSPPFATADDLEARWRALTDTEREQATALLDDAAVVIMGECASWASCSIEALRFVSCSMVKRAMLSMDAPGASNVSQTAGSFSESVTYSNPMGDLYLTKTEKNLLGVGRQHAYTVSMCGGGE